MNDYKHIYSSRLKSRDSFQCAFLFVGFLLLMGVVGNLEQEPAPVVEPPVVVVKSRTQEQIEALLPEPVAVAIVNGSKYPRTMAAIAHTESGGDHRAVGDGGKARGLFQVWGSLHGTVPDTIEGQVDQANRLFLVSVHRYGYKSAVARWNGTPSKPVVKKYQRTVLAKAEGLR